MPIVGFNFNKMNVEKLSSPKGKISINNNVALKDITEQELNFGKTKQKAAVFHVEFTCDYEPKIANILLVAEIVFLEDPKHIKSIMDQWKKDKTVDKNIMTVILNSALAKCNIQSMIISKDMNLPSPIPLPKVGVKEGTAAKK